MNDTSTCPNHTVALYETHDQAEAAVRRLNSNGFDMKKLSVIGQDYHTDEHPVGFVNSGDRMLSWGSLGAFWGAIWGLLFGSAMIFLPGLGYLYFAGWIVSTLEGALVGGSIGALAGALSSLGIPRDSVVKYETAIKAGSFILIAHGTEAETQRAKDILSETGANSIQSFDSGKTPQHA